MNMANKTNVSSEPPGGSTTQDKSIAGKKLKPALMSMLLKTKNLTMAARGIITNALDIPCCFVEEREK